MLQWWTSWLWCYAPQDAAPGVSFELQEGTGAAILCVHVVFVHVVFDNF